MLLGITIVLGLISAQVEGGDARDLSEITGRVGSNSSSSGLSLEKINKINILAAKPIELSAPQIDRCVNKHLEQQPDTRGVANIHVLYNPDGTIRMLNVVTSFSQAHRFRGCLDIVVHSWDIPKQSLSELDIIIPVYKGAEFTLYPYKNEQEQDVASVKI